MHTPLLKPGGSPMSWNFQQVHQDLPSFELNANSDDITQADLMSPAYFIFSWGLTSCKFTSLQGANYI